MTDNFDMVEYPFKIKDDDPLYLESGDGVYETRIVNTLESKKIYATPKNNESTIFHIRIENGKAEIVGRTETVYEFVTPADFYIPIPQETKNYYNELYDRMIYSELDDFLEYTKSIPLNPIPLYVPPVLSSGSIFQTYQFKNYITQKSSNRQAIQIRIEDSVPEAFTSPNEIKLRDKYGEDIFKEIKNIIDSFITNNPIFKLRNLHKIILNNDFFKKENISIYKTREFVPCLAYYYTSGPWKGCWVRLGYDPKLHKENFKYQIIGFKRICKARMLYEIEDVYSEINENQNIYTNDVFDYSNGFLKVEALELIKKRLSKPIILKNIEIDDDELDFEVFD
ncbi:General transcription factor 3C polypeptide 5 [Astathelohania contejeani]|uniref:General transcription factor 3C polypeptide 5 n=1 Tax=Astathelohania contejeani TaxID=164912 RepID=A0ABQ7HYB8_9MICR|nr:General transcription factor 3C polypeptide 5 [Thelohania contejeani]